MSKLTFLTEETNVPTILAVAESTHYLVGRYDSLGSFTGLDKSNDVAVFNSLIQAKQYLRGKCVVFAAIEFQSAYDEMCGSSSLGKYHQLVNLSLS